MKAAWDNFHVREVEGFSSGISGDADGDGVCDVDFDPGSCGAVQFHRVEKKTKRLSAHNPDAEPGTYRLRLMAHHRGRIHAELPDGTVAEIRGRSGFSKPIEFTLPRTDPPDRLPRRAILSIWSATAKSGILRKPYRINTVCIRYGTK